MYTAFKKEFLRLGLTLISIFSTVSLRPDGLIIINNLPEHFVINKQPARFNIKYHNVNVNINNQIATTSVNQVFENPYSYDLEGTYIFPIPEQANISDFKMYVNEKPLTAKILGKDEARAEYEKIVKEKKDPALLEYIGRSMFKASIYPIPANGQLRITLKYSEILKTDNGTVKYCYTLSTEKFSAHALDNVSVNVDIKSQQKILNVYSPTHQIDTKLDGTTNAKVTYAEKNVRPDRDFILYYTLPKDDFGFNVLSYKNGQEDGFFLAMMSPNCDGKTQQLVKKNILLVLDTSGSMYGAKLEQAKEALIFCLNHLNPDDKFNIVSFDSTVKKYENCLMNASAQNINNAIKYVNNLSSHGGTDINSALLETLKSVEKNEAPTMIIFLTDGEPTVGICDIASIIKNINSSNIEKIRLFSFGVGYDVNTKLLDKLSLDNKGISEYIEPNEKIEEKVSNFYLKISNPVLTDIALNFSGVQVNEIYPIVLPDLFVGSQLLVVGRYKEIADPCCGCVELCLSGKQNAIEKQFIFNTTFFGNQLENDFLPRIWAGRKIAYLVDQILLEGTKDNLVNQIIELSRKYGIITEYTSFLITDGDSKKFSSSTVSDEMIKNSLASLKYASCDQTGKESVLRAKGQQTLRDSSTENNSHKAVIDPTTGSVNELFRNVRQRTFYFKDNIWIDSDHTDACPTVKIKIFSAEYFDLLKTFPDLGASLALGDKVIIKNGTISFFICD
jgi:Ca-activated chloride channel family protein